MRRFTISQLPSGNAYDEGRNAHVLGQSIAQCEYPMGSPRGRAWIRGYTLERNDSQDACEGIKGEVRHV